jgi:hypothetical protein
MGFGGVVWNRPVAVKVVTAAGVEYTLPVVDETRRRQIMIMTFGLVAAIPIALVFGLRRPKSNTSR